MQLPHDLLDIQSEKQGKDGMKFCSVRMPNLKIESEQTYVRRVPVKDTQHAWEDQ